MRHKTRAVTVKGGWRAMVARLLTLTLLFGVLFLPPCIEGDSLANAAAAITATVTTFDSQAGDPVHRGGAVHAGTHCNCQLGDRIRLQETLQPTFAGTFKHQVRATRSHPSQVTEPPSRPPQG